MFVVALANILIIILNAPGQVFSADHLHLGRAQIVSLLSARESRTPSELHPSGCLNSSILLALGKSRVGRVCCSQSMLASSGTYQMRCSPWHRQSMSGPFRFGPVRGLKSTQLLLTIKGLSHNIISWCQKWDTSTIRGIL